MSDESEEQNTNEEEEEEDDGSEEEGPEDDGSEEEGSGEDGSEEEGSGEDGSEEEGSEEDGSEDDEDEEDGSEEDGDGSGDGSDKEDNDKNLVQSNEVKIDITPFDINNFNIGGSSRRKSALEIMQEVNTDLIELYDDLNDKIDHFGEDKSFAYINKIDTKLDEQYGFDFAFMNKIKTLTPRHEMKKDMGTGTQSLANLRASYSDNDLQRNNNHSDVPKKPSKTTFDENIQCTIDKTPSYTDNNVPSPSPRASKNPDNIPNLPNSPKRMISHDIRSDDDEYEEQTRPRKPNQFSKSSGNNGFYDSKKKNNYHNYRTIEDLYKNNNNKPIIYSKDPNDIRRAKNLHQLNQSLNKKFSDSESNYPKQYNSGYNSGQGAHGHYNTNKKYKNELRDSLGSRHRNGSRSRGEQNKSKPHNIKHAMNILLDKGSDTDNRY